MANKEKLHSIPLALLVLFFLIFGSSVALAASEKPVADFYSPEINNQDNIRQIEPNAVISFFDNSTGSPTSWLWDFGDGNISTEQNPTHVYGAMGGYTVNLTVKNAVGSNTTSKYGYALIDLGDEPVSPAYFSSSATSGDAPFKVTFHEEGGGYLSSWTFGDGSQQYFIDDENSEIPEVVEHTYLEPGQYTVTLYQGNFGGKSAITKYHYITVTGLTRPVASFTADKVSIPKSLTIEFTDKSIGKPTSWSWNFGDGANSTEQNPMHTYSAAGNYTVNLTVCNENGTDSKLATINVLRTMGPFAYITNVNDRTISVIDTATDNVVGTLDIGSSSNGVAVSQDGKKVYVTDGNNVCVIDTTISKVIATVNAGYGTHGVAVSPDGAKVYVANFHSNNVSVIDTASNNVTATVSVGSGPWGVAVSPDGKKVYVANTGTSNVSVIDTATNVVTDTLYIGQYPWGIAVNPEGTKVYVANYGYINYSPSHNVSVIDTATNTVTDRVKVGNGPYGVAVNPKGTKVYVTNYWENTTSVINTTTNTVIATVPVGGGPYGVSVTPDGKKVYVANQGSNYDLSGKTVSVIDAATNTVTTTVNVGKGPTAFGQFIAPMPVPEQVLPVANFNSNVTEGYFPLTVQFIDISQKATSRIWEFNGDGQPDSSDINPVYVYANAGTYTVNLTVSNENGTASKTATINVLTPSSSSGDSSSGSSHSSSSGSSGGGAGVSPEPAKNVQAKELSQAFVTNGKPVKFDFPKNATCVVYVSFDSKKTAGKTTTIAEQLKNKSTLVSELNAGEVYKYFNVWVGTGGFATSKNIENLVVCFKVEKSWLQDKNIDQNSIILSRYSDKKWSQLPVKLLCEKDKYLYFTAETPEFSFFAITGKAVEKEKVAETKPANDTSKLEQNGTTLSKTEQEQKSEQEIGKGKATSIPGFGMVCGIVCLITLFLHKRR